MGSAYCAIEFVVEFCDIVLDLVFWWDFVNWIVSSKSKGYGDLKTEIYTTRTHLLV